MSNAVYPRLLGESYPVKKTPVFSTIVQESASGNEVRIANYTSPRLKFEIPYEYLSDVATSYQNAVFDLQSLMGFYIARYGKFDSFLYDDASDNTATASGFGIGDGTTVAFQLARQMGVGSQPVYDLKTDGVNAAVLGTGASGYLYPPPISFSGGGGQGAEAVAILSGSTLSAIVMKSAGWGYGSAPAIAIPGGSTATAVMAPRLYLNGSFSGSGYSIANGLVTFGSAPGSGVVLSADFAHYWRCRFDDDSLEFQNDYHGFWSAGKVTIYQTRQ